MMMYSDSTKSGFIGFIPDLLKKISIVSNITFDINHVQDNRYGAKTEWGNWTGMIGELTTNVSMVLGLLRIYNYEYIKSDYPRYESYQIISLAKR